jgi:glucose-6-phosphate-specific signal transduction histidine kinase
MGILTSLKEWFVSIHIAEQIKDVDIVGLFTNPWFIIPFVLLIGYLFFKQNWKDLIIITIFVGIWWVSGTNYMDTLLVNGEISIEKILPVIFGGAVVLGFVIYIFFGRSD